MDQIGQTERQTQNRDARPCVSTIYPIPPKYYLFSL
jgi:hypothetical protein